MSELRPQTTTWLSQLSTASLLRFLSSSETSLVSKTWTYYITDDWTEGKMFGNFVQRIQESFSPVTSPVSSPKVLRRRFKSPNRGPAPTRAALPPSSRQRGPNSRRNLKDEYREVQSEPELDNYSGASAGSRRLLDKRKNKSRLQILDISQPIPIEPRNRSLDTDSSAFTANSYCSSNDITLSPSVCEKSFSPKPSDHYGVVTENHKEPVYSAKYQNEKVRNGFHYVNSVPNIRDQSIYETIRSSDLRSRNEIGKSKVDTFNSAGIRKCSRIEDFHKRNRDNIYWSPGFAPLQGSKSLGRLDGIKEVSFLKCFWL